MPKLVFAEIALKCQRYDEVYGSRIEEVFIKSDGIEYRLGFTPWGNHSFKIEDTVNTGSATKTGSNWTWSEGVISPYEEWKNVYSINRVTGEYKLVSEVYKTKDLDNQKLGQQVSRGSCELLKRKF